jgi:hypothetical protein
LVSSTLATKPPPHSDATVYVTVNDVAACAGATATAEPAARAAMPAAARTPRSRDARLVWGTLISLDR